MATPVCNICGGTRFEDYRGRPAERCAACGGKARHRVVWAAYRALIPHGARVLHLAPEACLHDRLRDHVGEGYRTADYAPERYPHASAMRLRLPDDLPAVADGSLDYLIHNHVLEHVPGAFRDWMPDLLAKLAAGGAMIFTVPGPYAIPETLEGGEKLATDAERLQRFLQEDHVRLFGQDLMPFLRAQPGGYLEPDPVSEAERTAIGVRPGKSPVLVWRRDR